MCAQEKKKKEIGRTPLNVSLKSTSKRGGGSILMCDPSTVPHTCAVCWRVVRARRQSQHWAQKGTRSFTLEQQQLPWANIYKCTAALLPYIYMSLLWLSGYIKGAHTQKSNKKERNISITTPEWMFCAGR